MPDYRQGGRFLYVHTPLGQDLVILKRFNGRDALSQLFRFELQVVAENAATVHFDLLMGQKVSFGVVGEQGEMTERHFNGMVVEVSQGARDKFFTTYTMTVVPEVWKLTKKFQSRIFQHITIPDILKKVLQGYDVQYELQGEWQERYFCVQHQETDFDFLSRLMEEEGIFYFFQFEEGSHKMVLANTPQSHQEIHGPSTVIFEEVHGGLRDDERITIWQKQQNWNSGKVQEMDHHSQLPHKKLEAEKEAKAQSITVGTVAHKLNVGGNEALEIYEHPGRYAQRFDGISKSGGEQASDLQKIFSDNKRVAEIRMAQSEVTMLRITGASNCRRLMSGYKFTLDRHPNANGSYVLVSVDHDAAEASIRSDSHESDENHYRNTFTCIPTALPYRPSRVTKRPLICGPQSAVVVGPGGEEIFTDKYGRIKVQFHWDRDGHNDADSSCWLQVASPWAGAMWGMISIPRIGQEVLVVFLNGDPDHPMVMGSVYDPTMMPPYELPKYKTVSAWKSRSSMGGGSGNYNEIRMEDKKGVEQMYVHGEKNMDTRVKEEHREWVGHNKHKIVMQSEYINVKQDQHNKIVGDCNEEILKSHNEHVQQDWVVKVDGDHNEAIGGDEQVKIGGKRVEKVGSDLHVKVGSNHEEKTGMKYAVDAGMEIHLKAGGKVVIEAMQVSLKGAGGFVDIGPSGVTIMGTMVLINSGGAAGSGGGSSPADASPKSPTAPTAPDVADSGPKFDKD